MTETFDPNFCFPVKDLENDWIKLTPFNPVIHGNWYWENTKDHPELYNHFHFGPFDHKEKLFRAVFTERVQPDRGYIVYAVYDKVFEPNPTPAGIIGLVDASPMNLSAEIGLLITFPRYQRTHVTSNMVGLLLQYCLDLPERGGLGLRRVQWQANVQNNASTKTALRMGFQHEGVKRWDRVILPSIGKPNAVENIPREGDPRRTAFGRHSALFGLCWDEWEDGTREKVGELMKPRGDS